ncbi:MAG: hypothetical protein Q7T25_01080 [Sideroxyarcus sp.]|nr:hypothetical protein [Sideroxyarcus sp.]
MMTEIPRETLGLVYGGDVNGGTAAAVITTAAAIGAGAGVSGQLTAAGGWAAFGTIGAGPVAAALGGVGASLVAGLAIGTAINNIGFVNRGLGDLVDWIFGT